MSHGVVRRGLASHLAEGVCLWLAPLNPLEVREGRVGYWWRFRARHIEGENLRGLGGRGGR